MTDGSFFNPGGAPKKSFRDLLRWKLSGERETWPPHVQWGTVVEAPAAAAGTIAITFINHSSFLVSSTEGRLLLDPVWSQRVGPWGVAGPRRVHEPGVQFATLPDIKAVLVSHDHYDHLDLRTLAQLNERFRPEFITGLGNGYWMKRAGAERPVELDWWQTYQVPGFFSATFTPAHHWSGRSFTDRQNTLWGGFVIELAGRKIYFAGDTGLMDFQAIKARLGAPDLCILPIGAFEPRWFMKDNHLSPAEAVSAHQSLGCQQSIACHFGTFQVSDESWQEPVVQLKAALANANDAKPFHALSPGQSLVLAGEDR